MINCVSGIYYITVMYSIQLPILETKKQFINN